MHYFKMRKKPTHGGKREGAGRPAEGKERFTVTLTAESVKVHKDAAFLNLATQSSGASPIPFHPGAVRYLKEKGINVQ